MQLPQLLLIDDDRSIARALALALRGTYEVDIVGDGSQAISRGGSGEYRAIILDLDLPDVPGLDVCRRLRDEDILSPILILTGDDQVLTKIKLLDAGANDYLTKPFSLGELKARLRVLTRAIPSRPRSRKLAVGALELDRSTHTVTREGSTITLRRKEFALLECLMENAGSIVTRTMLTRHGWHGAEEPWTNTVDVHIKYLRDKLDRPFEHRFIKTVHGLGYKLDTESVTTKGS